MKERPILFSGPMVRALLAGTKTQTRRVVNAPTTSGSFVCSCNRDGIAEVNFGLDDTKPNGNLQWHRCRYGTRGEYLWVRESHYIVGEYREVYFRSTNDSNFYKQDVAAGREPLRWPGPWKPSIHMPRWASRITLRITDVRVQRLQDISPKDAIAEGIEIGDWADIEHDARHGISVVDRYRDLWESINGPGSWAANPWVWALTFDRVSPA